LELKGKEGYSECRTQQTSERLQEYGVDFLKVVEGVRGAQNGQCKCISSQEWGIKVIWPEACVDGQKFAKVECL
jgi:hypothetical protein